MKYLTTLLCVTFLISCSKGGNVSVSNDELVLESSAFYSGETAAGVRSSVENDEAGYIPQGETNSGNVGDSGTILLPTENTSSSPEPVASESPTSSTTTSDSSSTSTPSSEPSSQPTVSVSSGGDTSSSTSSSPLGSSSSQSTEQAAVTDGGFISGSSSNSGSSPDTGTVDPTTTTTGTTENTGSLTNLTQMLGGLQDALTNLLPGSTSSTETSASSDANPSPSTGSTTDSGSVIISETSSNANSNPTPSSTSSSDTTSNPDSAPSASDSVTTPSTNTQTSTSGSSSTPTNTDTATNVTETNSDTTTNTPDSNSTINTNSDVSSTNSTPVEKTLKVTISRICSERRSQDPNFVFYEDAKNPIMSLEAFVPSPKYSENILAGPMPTWLVERRRTKNKTFTNVVLQSTPLESGEALESRYQGLIHYSLARLKNEFMRRWRDALLGVMVCDDTNSNGSCADELQKNQLLVRSPIFGATRIPQALRLEIWNGRNYTLRNDPDWCEKQYSPLLLDLAGDGFRLTGPESGVRFDLNDTGSKIMTGWVATNSDDAFLVRDVNGNKKIDSGAELFGSATRLKSGARAVNGFEALREMDTNKDGKIDKLDKTFKWLRLWSDKNANAVVDKREISTLQKAGIQEISLNYIDVMEVDPYGNETRQRSTFHRKVRGKTYSRLMIDVWFNTLVEH